MGVGVVTVELLSCVGRDGWEFPVNHYFTFVFQGQPFIFWQQYIVANQIEE